MITFAYVGTPVAYIYSDLVEGRSQWDPIPMEDLIELNNEWKGKHMKNLGILVSTSGIISIISSSTLIWMILRSHKGLSTTQHRLLLGLCVYDIMLSLSCSTFNAAVPSEMNYRIWNVRGNEATCDAQGFLTALGATGGLYYNAALNLYFLAVVKYEKNDAYVRTKIEPFLHAVPILVSLTYSISLLIGKHYNSTGFDGRMALCYDTMYFPQHCEGYDVGETRPGFDIPCGRGLEGAMTLAISCVIVIFIPVIIIFISLGIIYGVVRTQEKKLARYASFRTNLQQSILNRNIQTPQEQESDNRHHLLGSIRSSLSRSWTTLVSSSTITATASSSIRSNDTKSKSRAVMHKAFGYSIAWLLSYGVYTVGSVIFFAGSIAPISFDYIIAIFLPLQGFFNLAIYMLPKVVYAKKQGRGENVSICQAIRKAFWSRGSARPIGSGTNGRHSRRGGWSRNLHAGGDNRQTSSPHPRPLRRNNNATDTSARHLGSTIQHLRRPRKERQEEEEKCEIQAAQSMMPSKKRTSLVTFAPNQVIHVPTITDGGDDVKHPEMSNFDGGGETEDVDSSKSLHSQVVADGDNDICNNEDPIIVGNDDNDEEDKCEIQAPHNMMPSHKKKESLVAIFAPNLVPADKLDGDDMNTLEAVSGQGDDENVKRSRADVDCPSSNSA